MILGRVIGSVVSTRKEEALVGFKILMVEEYDPKKPEAEGARFVAVDTLGAGRGDTVLVVRGGGARVISDVHKNAPIDSAIVGIVDSVGV